MKWGIKIFFIQALLINTVIAKGQDNSTHAIGLIARAVGDSIVLRWAPTSPLSWKLLNKYGYQIERFTIVRDTTVLENKIQEFLTTVPILPASQSAWVNYIERDDYVAVAAQAIFGDDFQLSKKGSGGFSLVAKSQEMESRYSFAIYAADLSREAAKLSGLRYVDRNIKKNEKYLYKVHSLIPKNILDINSGVFFIGLADKKILIKPRKPDVEFRDKSVLISWDSRSLRETYTAFNIEKSKNGKEFTKINGQPISFLESSTNDWTVFPDTLLNNTQTTFYRIVGLTPFGEIGPPSEYTSGMGIPVLNEQAVINDVKIISNTVQLQWLFKQEAEELITGFEIERSAKSEKGFIKVATLTPYLRAFTDQKPEATNYYRIVSRSKSGDEKTSLPVLAQLQDSIPPAPPIDFVGKIDSAGLLTLAWSKNTEPDFLGYRVYKSNFENSEFSLVSDSTTADNQFQERINTRTLTSKMYYKINALDKRYNPSDFSKILTVDLPDHTSPVAPVLKHLEQKESGNLIEWVNSSSDDVSSHQLLRKNKNSQDWDVIKVFHKGDSTVFLDKEILKQECQYRMIAIDRNGLKSIQSNILHARSVIILYPSIENIKVAANRNEKSISLNWKYDYKDVSKFIIYRSSNDEPMTMYKSIPGNSEGFKDINLTINTTYIYRVRAIYKDRGESSFSKAIKIIY
jgi:hypothetical protein